MSALKPMNTRAQGWGQVDWGWLAAIAMLAVGLRAVFFTGFFGSDEVTYTKAALSILEATWERSEYIGSIRFGVNLPVAFLMGLLGVNEVGAAAWAFLTSVAEVLAVYAGAHYLLGRRVAVLAGLILALMPLHVHLGGRLMADSPLALFITLSFLLFKIAQDRNSSSVFFVAGLAAGAVFWIKESATVFVIAFVLYPVVFRTWNVRWGWMILGAALIIAANSVMFWVVAGNPLHLLSVVRLSALRFVEAIGPESSPWFYLRYLFLDVRHTWLSGPLALGAVFLYFASRLPTEEGQRSSMRFILMWGVGLLALFSFAIVSIDPIKFVLKQTNYMTIFMAPLAIMAAWFITRLARPLLYVALATVFAGSLVLSALEQQAIKVFTANSKAAVRFAQEHRDIIVFGPTSAVMAASYYDTLLSRGDPAGADIIRPLEELFTRSADGPLRLGDGRVNDKRIVAVVDLQTLARWQHGMSSVEQVPGCWRRISQLMPVMEGAGQWIARALAWSAAAVPKFGDRLQGGLAVVTAVRPAYVFEVPKDCVGTR